nr:substrate-binding domain-containing protein [Oceanobacter mangrovi]
MFTRTTSTLPPLRRLLTPFVMGAALMGATLNTQAAEDKLNVYVSFGFYGNTWMEQNRNMMEALAASKDYKDKINLKVQVVGNGDPQRQSQQINAMTEAGADVIVLYPVSPTALNRAIKNACRRGVTVMTWDSTVTESCATNVHADNKLQAEHQAQWIADKLEGKGNILMINGLNGAAASDDRVKAAKALWSKYPGLKVVGEVEGKWSDPVVREEVSKFMAVRSWNDIDMVFAQLGCYPVYALQDEAGIADADKVPCAGSAENAERLALLPADTKVDGASGSYRPMGIDGYTFEVGPAMGAQALKYGVDAKLAGKKLDHDIVMPAKVVTADNAKLCTTADFADLSSGCNTFSPALAPNPETSTAVYSEELPQLNLNASLTGTPEY